MRDLGSYEYAFWDGEKEVVLSYIEAVRSKEEGRVLFRKRS